MVPFLLLLVALTVLPSTICAQAVSLSDNDMDEITLRNQAPLAPCKLNESDIPCSERFPQIFSNQSPISNSSNQGNFQLPLNPLDNALRANRFQVEQILQSNPSSISNGAPAF